MGDTLARHPLRRAVQAQLGDAVAVAADHGEPPPVDDEVVADVGDAAEPGQDEPGERLVLRRAARRSRRRR